MFKLLACDIDHTILPPGGSVSDRDIAALHRLHQAGVVVVLASGRARASTRRILEGIFREERPDYLISYNGARVDSLAEERTLLATNLEPVIIDEIARWCRREGAFIQGYTDTNILVEEDNPFIKPYVAAASIPYRIVPSIAAEVTAQGGSPKLVCHDRQERLPHHIETLGALARGRWTVVTSIPYFLEILPPHTNKGVALRALAEHLGIPMEQTIALGDNLNDMEMIREAGMGLAVANAVPQLKEIADWVTTRDATQSALAEVVERYFP
ncbi:MAG: HAD family phosphatase [Spirochaetaceae bacterium]|nr:MAG: HAD family phosphatase [Spirochaetaceae bacterium]